MSATIDQTSYTKTTIAPKGSNVIAIEPKTKRPTERFQLQNAGDLLTRVFPPRELALYPWIPAKGITMLTAERGVGKTWSAIAVAYAVATGGEFLGWKAPKPRRVLIIDGEMGADELQERLKAIIACQPANATPLDPKNLSWIIGDDEDNGAPDIGNPEDQALLDQRADDYDLIIVDNLATLVRTGDENERKGWLPIQDWALRQKRKGKAVLFIHHCNKNGAQRGSSGREDTLASSVMLRRPMDYVASEGARFEVVFTKARGFHGDDAAPFEAHLQDGQWHTKPLTESKGGLSDAQAAILDALADGEPKALMQLKIATGKDDNALSILLSKMKSSGRVENPSRGLWKLSEKLADNSIGGQA